MAADPDAPHIPEVLPAQFPNDSRLAKIPRRAEQVLPATSPGWCQDAVHRLAGRGTLRHWWSYQIPALIRPWQYRAVREDDLCAPDAVRTPPGFGNTPFG